MSSFGHRVQPVPKSIIGPVFIGLGMGSFILGYIFAWITLG